MLGSNDGTDGLAIAPEDKIKYLSSQNKALELQLAYRTEISADSSSECKLMKEKVQNATKKYDEEKQFTFDVTNDMTRQYKAMKEELLNKINEKEVRVQNLVDQLGHEQKSRHTDGEKYLSVIESKQFEIDALKLKMENIAGDFRDMLSVLNKSLNERIEIHSCNDDDYLVSIQNKMGQFNLRSMIKH